MNIEQYGNGKRNATGAEGLYLPKDEASAHSCYIIIDTSHGMLYDGFVLRRSTEKEYAIPIPFPYSQQPWEPER